MIPGICFLIAMGAIIGAVVRAVQVTLLDDVELLADTRPMTYSKNTGGFSKNAGIAIGTFNGGPF